MATKTKGLLADVAAGVVAKEAKATRPARKGGIERRVSLVGDVATGRVKTKQQRLVEPERCKMWVHHNRRYDLLDSENCSDLIGKIEARGQTMPAIVRRLPEPEGEVEFEVIAGARRHFSVRYLRNEKGRDDILFLIDVQDLSDEEAFIIADLENRDRKDISDFERGLDYLNALDAFYGGVAKEMASRLVVDEKWLNRYLSLARLPSFIVELIGDIRDLKRDHADKLWPLLNQPAKRKKLEEEAAEIKKIQDGAVRTFGSPQLNAAQIVRRLVQAGEANRGKRKSKESRELRGAAGQKLGDAEISNRSIVIKIPRSKDMDVERMLSRVQKSIEG